MKQITYWSILIFISLLMTSFILAVINNSSQYFLSDDFKPRQIEIKKNEPLKILFLGDMMLDRTIRTKGEFQGYDHLFSCMKDLFKKSDHVIVNSEGSVTNNKSVSQYAEVLSPPSFRFTFDPEAVKAAHDSGIDVFGLANNHIYDFHNQGVIDTMEILKSMNIKFFGNPLSEENRTLTIDSVGKKKVTLIPFNEFYGKEEDTLSDLQKHQEDITIIFAHWGDEYVPPATRVRNWAHKFIDAGADLVIGHHPHVIQESEVYNGVTIYYSLGNFVFDQYWEEAVRTGLALEVEIEGERKMEFKENLLDIKRDGQTCPKLPAVI